jgi:hypothetical protein
VAPRPVRPGASDPETAFSAALSCAPPLARSVRLGRRAERLVSTGDLPNRTLTAGGPGRGPAGYAGYAGYAHESITRLGMSDAFRGADLVAEAIDRHLRADVPFDHVLGEVRAAPRRRLGPGLHIATAPAQLRPPGVATLMLMAAAGRAGAEPAGIR